MDALRDHRRSDLRHDLVGHRVRCSVNRRDHRVMDDRHVNRKCGLRDDDHRLPLDDRHRMGYHGADDLKMDVNLDGNRVNRNCVLLDLTKDANLDVSHGHRMSDLLDDLKLGVNLVVNLCHRRSDLLDDLNLGAMMGGNLYRHTNGMDDRNDRKMDETTDVSHDLRRNDLLDDRNLVAKMDGNLYRQTNVMDGRNDRKMDETTDVSLYRRTNDPLGDHLMDVDRHDDLVGHRKSATGDQNLDANRGHRMNAKDDRNDLMMVVNLLNRNCALHDPKMDVSRGHHMNDPLVYRKTDENSDVNRDLRMNDQLDDLNLDASRANRNCVRRDQMTDVNLDAMSHRAMLMVSLNMSCDRKSHDHLRCDHLKMPHRDTNRMDVKNLDGKMKIHRVNWY